MIRRNHRAPSRARAGRSGFNAATFSFTCACGRGDLTDEMRCVCRILRVRQSPGKRSDDARPVRAIIDAACIGTVRRVKLPPAKTARRRSRGGRRAAVWAARSRLSHPGCRPGLCQRPEAAGGEPCWQFLARSAFLSTIAVVAVTSAAAKPTTHPPHAPAPPRPRLCRALLLALRLAATSASHPPRLPGRS